MMLVVFLMIAILTGVRWNLNAVVILDLRVKLNLYQAICKKVFQRNNAFVCYENKTIFVHLLSTYETGEVQILFKFN